MALISAINLAYIALKTAKIEEMVDFYHQVLAFDELSYENDSVFLGNKWLNKPLLVLEFDEEYQQTNIDRENNYLTFKIRTLALFEQIYQNCQKANLEIIKYQEKQIERKLIIKDPDGHMVYIVHGKEFIDYEDYKIKQIYLRDNQGILTVDIDYLQGKFTKATLDKYFSKYDIFYNMEYKYDVGGISGLNYIVFDVINYECLEKLKAYLEQEQYSFYFNRGKQIIQLESSCGISYWFEVNDDEI